jgi:hypothetical protein
LARVQALKGTENERLVKNILENLMKTPSKQRYLA